MSKGLKAVSDKAKEDKRFAKELFVDEARACNDAGIHLERTELRILGDAMREVLMYLLKKLDEISDEK